MFSATFSEQAYPDWRGIFAETTLISGLELLAVIAEISPLRDFLMGRNAVFYIDKTNTKDALVKGSPPTPAINTPRENPPGFRTVLRGLVLVRTSSYVS